MLTAIRHLRSCGLADTMQPHKFLSAAKESGDPDLFYIVYKYFEDINIKQRKVPSFAPSDHCAEYERHFNVLFGWSLVIILWSMKSSYRTMNLKILFSTDAKYYCAMCFFLSSLSSIIIIIFIIYRGICHSQWIWLFCKPIFLYFDSIVSSWFLKFQKQ